MRSLLRRSAVAVVVALMLSGTTGALAAAPPPPVFSFDACGRRVSAAMRSERDTYRAAQYGDLSRLAPWRLPLLDALTPPRVWPTFGEVDRRSVLGTITVQPDALSRFTVDDPGPYLQSPYETAQRVSVEEEARIRSTFRTAALVRTTTLVPYLVENYHALSCRLAHVCRAIENSLAGGTGDLPWPSLPLGCSRLSLVRNRYDVAYADRGFPVHFPECTPTGSTAAAAPVSGQPETAPPLARCRDLEEEILAEEEAFLRAVTAFDATQRSLQRMAEPMTAFLGGLLKDVFEPVRELVGTLGLLHAVPCLQPHCD